MALDVKKILPNVSKFANIAVAEKSILVSSGLASGITADLEQGLKIDLRGWLPLSGAPVMQEDTTTPVSVNRFEAAQSLYSIQRPVFGVARTYLESAAAASNPAQYLGEKLGEYWASYIDKSAMASALGAAKSAALDDEALVDISAGSNPVITVEALFELNQGRTGYYVMSRKVWSIIRSQGLAESMVNPFNGVTGPAFDGCPVLIDDEAGTVGAAGVYNVYFFQQGAVGFKSQTNDAFLTSAVILGRGDAYASQHQFAIAIPGASFTGTPALEGGANLTELATGTNWAAGTGVKYLRHRVLVGKIAP